MEEQEPVLINNEEGHRFELHVKGLIGFVQYSQEEKNYLLMHTEVPPELEGHGVAKLLVEKTFAWLEKNGFTMTPYCPYIFAYLKRHPEWKRIEKQ